ncbi:MAG: alpha/beta fold hydrolase [Pyrinomonadaceae bacterium]
MITEEIELTDISAPPSVADGKPAPGISAVAEILRSRPFRPLSWLSGGHKQTLGAYFWPRPRQVKQCRTDEARLFQVEPDTQVLAHCRWQTDKQNSPTLILVHGLEGSTDSIYMRSMAVKAADAGFNVVRLNQRNCGGTEHLTPTLYHSGMNRDFLAVVNELIVRDGLRQIILSGISMSGNMVLQLAGEHRDELPPELIGICAVSPSVDLLACAAEAGKSENRFYRYQFVVSLKQRMQRKRKLFPDKYDLKGMEGIRFIKDFDAKFTVVHGGFTDVEDYYARCSSRPHIEKIRIPALVIHAEDDPVVPYHPLTDPVFVENPNVLLLATATGGHVGFLGEANPDEDRFWAENRVIEFARLLVEREWAR